ncbi:NAD(P)H-hydrate dehydratase [Rhodopirellula sp. JC740]|uniref:ADP-dependent (S)-NAD(P)H-hydrate dehydratase n=1 Tax=Rhodopirellula halodulae TaxID=2894198 RepID=A0ABS8NKH9_9BACT|nr:NAD(P)H-hydrate dehydratase [Rhodopirellula sp. JC740]MCC9644060.1 NAD(P)H-hydrate dehydratase [Rhodopirellula sp. JC740]
MSKLLTKAASPPPVQLPSRKQSAHKGNFGRVLLVGGSRGMAGSISLSSIAALHAGAGLVSAAVPDAVLESVAGFHPALMTIPLPCDSAEFSQLAWSELRSRLSDLSAVGCGPGMGTGAGSRLLVKGLLSQKKLPLVLDADAINVLSMEGWLDDEQFARSDEDAPCVLTPHPGELQRLTNASAKDVSAQLQAAEELVRRLNFTVVVKGGPSHVVGRSPGDANDTTIQVWQNTTGNPGMATAGCGDVLTGVVTSLLGQGLDAMAAAQLAVWVHGRSGDESAARHSYAGMTALHVLETLADIADEMTSD